MNTTPHVTVRDLAIEFNGTDHPTRPIDGLDLDLTDGQLVLIVGPSGCGKTTLLSALAGLLTPAAGTIQVGATTVTGLEGRRLAQYRRHDVGVVFQDFHLLPSLTATENVMVPLLADRRSARRARNRAVELLTRLDLGHRLGHRPGQLSGGQRQRVAIARALSAGPGLLLADEPTAHLDRSQVDSVCELFRSLATPGRIVVATTHDDRLLGVADRVINLDAPTRPSSVSAARSLAAARL